MAGATRDAVIEDANEAALMEFEAGLRRSIKQADEGLVNTFKTKEEFLNHFIGHRLGTFRTIVSQYHPSCT